MRMVTYAKFDTISSSMGIETIEKARSHARNWMRRVFFLAGWAAAAVALTKLLLLVG